MNRDHILLALADLRTNEIVVTTMGCVRPWGRLSDHDLDFASADSAMGHAADLALGIALAQPSRQVLCLNGDGSMLMSLGTLVTIADAAPSNLFLFVFDNGAYEITGGQTVPGPEDEAHSINYPALAHGAGFTQVYSFYQAQSFTSELPNLLEQRGPVFVHLKVDAGSEGPITRTAGESARYLQTSLAEWSESMRLALADDAVANP